MAVALAQAVVHKARTGVIAGGGTTTIVINGVTAGNTLVLCLAYFSGNAQSGVTVTSSPTNTWNALTPGSGDASSHVNIQYAMNVAGGNTTVTLAPVGSGLNTDIEGDLFEISGVPTTGVLDVQPTVATGSSAAPAIASGALATADEILVAIALHTGADATWDPDTAGGYTQISENEDNDAGQTYSAQYKIVSSSASDTADWSLGAGAQSRSWTAKLASFRGSGAVATWEQEGYRWRDDDGSETTATWLAAQDTSLTRPTGQNARLRVLVDSGGADPATTQLRLDYKLSSASIYAPVEVVGGAAAAFGAIGTGTSTGTTAPTVAYPTGITAGQLLIMAVANRPNASTVATPAGWTAPASNTIVGGAGSEAVGTGSIRTTVFTRVADGTESGSVTLAITGGTSVGAVIWRATKTTGKQWSVALATGTDNTAGTAVSVAFSSNPGVTAGDLVYVAAGTCQSAAFSAEAITQAGMTYGTMTEHLDQAVTTGNDLRLVVTGHAITSGTSSGNATWTATGGSTSAGSAIMIRLRQVDQPITLALSSNVAASGENTTAQLSAPVSGHTFSGGRLQDDENPADTVDLALDTYGEWEWCVVASTTAQTAEVYDFRITRTGTVLNTYSANPQWTIGTAPAIPTITDVEGTETFADAQTNVTITGTNFNAAQGDGKVELGSTATYATATKVLQTATSWSSTSIDFTASLGGLTAGTLYLYVTNSDEQTSAAQAVTVTSGAASIVPMVQMAYRRRRMA